MANISVKVGNNMSSALVILDDNTTLRQAFEANGYNYGTSGIHLGGAAIEAEDLDKTFAEMGCVDFTTLISVVKADGGTR